MADCVSPSNANFSIDGLGVRYATYANTAMCLVTIVIAAWARHSPNMRLFKRTEDDIKMNAANIFIGGCGLLIACFYVWTRKDVISLYDAIIVLFISWLNILTAGFSTLLRTRRELQTSTNDIKFWVLKTGLYEIYTVFAGIFGIALFWDIGAWAPGCAEQYKLVILNSTFYAMGRGVKIGVLTLSAFTCAPVLNVFVPYTLIRYLSILEFKIRRCDQQSTPWFALCLYAAPTCFLFYAMEAFVAQNSHVIGSNADYQFTFATVLAFFPVFNSGWKAIDRVLRLTYGSSRDSLGFDDLALPIGMAKHSTAGSRQSSYSSVGGEQRYSRVST